jgi:hypothetical protein
MNENLHIILIILAILLLMGWTIFDWVKLNRKIKSKTISDKKEGINELKNYASENNLISLIDYIGNLLKKIF